ncbi:MAG: hypothetical protein AB7U98_05920 [Candidatus Nitrosocosmicus sp.]|jgi:hypothetical protein|nr:hypothetical protein [Candidatus Nitrosocosmicus sp.]
MSKEKINKPDKVVPDYQIERQKNIDEGGPQEYDDRNQRKTKGDNILIDWSNKKILWYLIREDFNLKLIN